MQKNDDVIELNLVFGSDFIRTDYNNLTENQTKEYVYWM